MEVETAVTTATTGAPFVLKVWAVYILVVGLLSAIEMVDRANTKNRVSAPILFLWAIAFFWSLGSLIFILTDFR